MLFIFVPILSSALLALNLLLAPSNPDEAKVSSYECGMNPVLGQTRSTFHIHFFVVALLFLIFDLEILLLFPLAVSLYQVSVYGLIVAITFFIVLTVGFILEIGSGAIQIISLEAKDTSKNNNLNPLYCPKPKFYKGIPSRTTAVRIAEQKKN